MIFRTQVCAFIALARRSCTVVAPLRRAGIIAQVFGRWKLRALHANQRQSNLVCATVGLKGLGKTQIVVGRGIGEYGTGQKPFLISRADFLGGRRRTPRDLELGGGQECIGLAPPVERYNQNRQALVAGPSRATRTVKERFGIVRKIGVNDESERRQIEPARRYVRCDENPRAAITERLQRMGTLVLRQLSG